MSCQSVLITRLLQNLLMSDMLELVDDHQTQAYSDIIIRNAALPLDRLSLRAGPECNRPSNATQVSNSVTPARVAGSVTLTPKSRFFINRVKANEAIKP